jgi:hypothetical protein
MSNSKQSGSDAERGRSYDRVVEALSMTGGVIGRVVLDVLIPHLPFVIPGVSRFAAALARPFKRPGR